MTDRDPGERSFLQPELPVPQTGGDFEVGLSNISDEQLLVRAQELQVALRGVQAEQLSRMSAGSLEDALERAVGARNRMEVEAYSGDAGHYLEEVRQAICRARPPALLDTEAAAKWPFDSSLYGRYVSQADINRIRGRVNEAFMGSRASQQSASDQVTKGLPEQRASFAQTQLLGLVGLPRLLAATDYEKKRTGILAEKFKGATQSADILAQQPDMLAVSDAYWALKAQPFVMHLPDLHNLPPAVSEEVLQKVFAECKHLFKIMGYAGINVGYECLTSQGNLPLLRGSVAELEAILAHPAARSNRQVYRKVVEGFLDGKDVSLLAERLATQRPRSAPGTSAPGRPATRTERVSREAFDAEMKKLQEDKGINPQIVSLPAGEQLALTPEGDYVRGDRVASLVEKHLGFAAGSLYLEVEQDPNSYLRPPKFWNMHYKGSDRQNIGRLLFKNSGSKLLNLRVTALDLDEELASKLKLYNPIEIVAAARYAFSVDLDSGSKEGLITTTIDTAATASVPARSPNITAISRGIFRDHIDRRQLEKLIADSSERAARVPGRILRMGLPGLGKRGR